MKYIDLTQTICNGMQVFPGEKSPSVTRDKLPEDVGYVTHRLETNMHTGTHIDAPFHAKSDTISIDKYPVDYFSGKTAVIDVRNQKYIKMSPEWEFLFQSNQIVLFCTGHSNFWSQRSYYYNYPEFDSEIAISLVRNKVRIVGFDSPSPDKDPFEFHSIYLCNERFLVENLTNLESIVGKKDITFIAFPLKIEAEASLIRAVAMVNE